MQSVSHLRPRRHPRPVRGVRPSTAGPGRRESTAPGLALARWAVAWLIAFATVLVGSEARAEDYGIVTLDLSITEGDVPTHLCVVTEAKSSRTRKLLWDVLEAEPDVIGGDGGQAGVSWRVQPSVWGGDSASAEEQRCTSEPVGDCRPRVELPAGLSRDSQLYVACTADSLTEGVSAREPRPLFIFLEHLEGSPPQVESVRLAGGIATIGVVKANFDRVIVTARSLGGHYLPHTRSQRASLENAFAETGGGPLTKSVRLELTPRCQVVEVQLPRTRVGPQDRNRLSVWVHGFPLDVDKCVYNLVGTEVIQVRVPPSPMGVGSVEVELAGTGEGQTAARVGGGVEGKWPRAPFALQFNQVTFSWRRPDCIYPKDRCPTATLETGTVCASTVTETGCDYRCPEVVSDEGAIGLELPLAVTFEKSGPRQRWTDKLAINGQELTSYVPADQIYLEANINEWKTNIPDNRITDIEIFGEDGQARTYGVTSVDSLLLKVPGASCESLRFRPVGDRNYDEVVATVDDGKLDFGNPHRSARRIGFNLLLAFGGGPAWSAAADPPPLYFTGLGMVGVHARSRRPGWQRIAFEFRAGGTLGHWGRTQGAEDDSEAGSDQKIRRFGWARVLFEPGLVFSLHDRIAVGPGFAVGFSLPFQQEQEVTQESIKFIWSPSLDLRFRLRRWLRLVLQFRGIFGEVAFRTVGSDPIPEGETARSLVTLMGLQASF